MYLDIMKTLSGSPAERWLCSTSSTAGFVETVASINGLDHLEARLRHVKPNRDGGVESVLFANRLLVQQPASSPRQSWPMPDLRPQNWESSSANGKHSK